MLGVVMPPLQGLLPPGEPGPPWVQWSEAWFPRAGGGWRGRLPLGFAGLEQWVPPTGYSQGHPSPGGWCWVFDSVTSLPPQLHTWEFQRSFCLQYLIQICFSILLPNLYSSNFTFLETKLFFQRISNEKWMLKKPLENYGCNMFVHFPKMKFFLDD